METYRNTQYSHVLIGIVIVFVVIFYFVGSNTLIKGEIAALTLFIFAFVFLFFHKLTVIVDDKFVTALFGMGFIKRRVLLSDIEEVKQVRNSWLMGYGIRWIGNGWMFNVSGLDAVDLKIRGKNHFRIGTNQPDRLSNAILLAKQIRD